jgi:hypothetical protein
MGEILSQCRPVALLLIHWGILLRFIPIEIDRSTTEDFV